MDDDKITLDRETFKALAVDSRVKILRILDDRENTLTDLFR
jgi:DNA-binding transcriptional ArsR family regulator